MSDFLQFLNTADKDSLAKLSGITPSLAENLMAARPFEAIEDCLKVQGMKKNLLARAQTSYEKSIHADLEEEKALVPVEQEDQQEPVSVEKSQSVAETPKDEPKAPIGSRFGQAILWFFRALLRLILIVLVIGGIGFAIYYGVPRINEKFVAPVEQNAMRVSELENEVSSLQDQFATINNQLTELNNQLTETNNRIEGIQQSVDAHTTSLSTLEEMQATLEAQLESGNDKTLLALKHEVMLTRILDTLARARLYLAQSNFGLAKEDVQSARDLLDELQVEAQDEALQQAADRLDLALANLPAFPVVASGDLEIAWQILMTGETVATATPEATLTTTPLPETTPEPTLSVTPTP